MNRVRDFLALAHGFALLVLFASAGTATADPVVPGAEHCVVNVRSDDRLNLRAQPNARSAIVAGKAYGDCGILVHQCAGSWCSVEDGHSAGWVHRRYIAMVSPALYCVANVPAGDGLNLRAYPSAGSRILTQLGRHQCDIAFLPYAVGNWQKIRAAGWQGWVNRRYLSGQ
jgi:SH3-like domain-containing protein